MTNYLFPPVTPPTIPIRGQAQVFPVRRLFFVGRNYYAHAVEMGHAVDKSVDRPFYFTKSLDTVVIPPNTIPYPSETNNFHYEMELVIALHKPGFRVQQAEAHQLIYGYAAGLDMTRRDLQLIARDKSKPWDLGKDVEYSSVCSEIVPMPEHVIKQAAIVLDLNGQTKQSSNIDKLIWGIPEIIADLSLFYHLQAGDLIYTGTPEGVGPVQPGDLLSGRVEGVAEVSLRIGPKS